MCCGCNTQTHVRIIAIICITLTGLGGFLSFIPTLINHRLAVLDGASGIWIIGVQMVIIIVHLVSYNLCLIGANKRNKWLLIPFMILTSLHILVSIIFEMYLIFVFFTNLLETYHPTFLGTLVAILLLPVIIALPIVVGLSIYFLVIVIKFQSEISSGIISGQQQGMVLQSCNTSQTVQQGGGVAVVYIPSSTQNVTCQYPQRAPYNPYPLQDVEAQAASNFIAEKSQ